MKKIGKKQKSILQDQSEKQCYLCMVLHEDYGYKQVENHHIYFGNSNRKNSEFYGFKANLCLMHHRIGKEAVHNNRETDLILKRACQEEFEKTHTRQEFVKIIGKSYLGGDFEHTMFSARKRNF